MPRHISQASNPEKRSGFGAGKGHGQFGAGRLVADNAHRSQRIEMESPSGAALQLGMNILRQHLRLAKCELGRGRARFAVFASLTAAQSPSAQRPV